MVYYDFNDATFEEPLRLFSGDGALGVTVGSKQFGVFGEGEVDHLSTRRYWVPVPSQTKRGFDRLLLRQISKHLLHEMF